MKKNVVNSKVLRAITMGLVAMLTVTATPMTAFAAEDSDNGNDPEQTQNSGEQKSATIQNDGAGEEDSQASMTVAEIKNEVSDASTDASAAQTAISEAGEAVDVFLESEEVLSAISDGDITAFTEIKEDLNDGSIALSNASSDLAGAESALNTADSFENAADLLIGTATGELDDAESILEDLDTDMQTTSQDADGVISDAATANDENASESVARAAAESAVSNLQTVEEALADVINDYAEAEQKVQDAQTEYESALEEHALALQNVAKAQEKLADAKEDAVVAKQELADAQEKADALAEKISTLQETQEELEAIQEQYYAMMVYYYRATNSAVYNNDGTLNLEKSAEKSGKTYLNNKNYFMLGRYLAAEMIRYYLENDENVDADSESITIGETGNKTVTAQEGVVFKNSNHQDQTNTTETTKKDDQKKTVERGEYYDLQWNTTGQADSGRTNHVVVTYTDIDGNEQTRYFNYILKEGKYESESDFTTGTIYLAEITVDSEGNYSYQKVEDSDYVMDDYQKLLSSISSIAYLAEYQAAQSAVSEAASKVSSLEEQIAQLESVKADSSAINALKKQLESAQEDLEKAGENKRALEEKVQEARDAVASIDLSRFNVSSSSETVSSSGNTSNVTSDAEESEEADGINVVLSDLDLDDNAVAGADRNDNTSAALATSSVAAVSADNDEADGNEATNEANAVTVIEDEDVALSDTPEATEDKDEIRSIIEEEVVALASTPIDDDEHMSWWWILIVAAFGTAGKALYEQHKKKLKK